MSQAMSQVIHFQVPDQLEFSTVHSNQGPTRNRSSMELKTSTGSLTSKPVHFFFHLFQWCPFSANRQVGPINPQRFPFHAFSYVKSKFITKGQCIESLEIVYYLYWLGAVIYKIRSTKSQDYLDLVRLAIKRHLKLSIHPQLQQS